MIVDTMIHNHNEHNIPLSSLSMSPPSPSNPPCFNSVPFPMKLHALLEDASRLGFDDVVCWQPGGTSFKVLQPKRFDTEIMKKYFQQTKYKSFQRQLNIYGFRRVHHGPLKGGYTHPSFTRENPDLQMTRKAKHRRGTMPPKDQHASSEEMYVPMSTSTIDKILTLSHAEAYIPLGFEEEYHDDDTSEAAMNELLTEFLSSGDSPEDKPDQAKHHQDVTRSHVRTNTATHPEHVTSMGGSVVTTAQRPSSSSASPLSPPRPRVDGPGSRTQPEVARTTPEKQKDAAKDESNTRDSSSSERYFPCKLHIMLEDAESEGFADIVSWVEDGTAFKVHKRKEFVEKVMPNYFDQTQFESFRRQLNMYGFSRINKGKDRGVAAHPYFLQGQRSLCQKVTRVTKQAAI